MSEENIVEDVQEVEEATEAQSSMKPNSKSSKSDMLAQMMKIFSGMKKEDLSKFMTDTLAQVGKEDETVPDYSAKNKASIATKGSSAPAPTKAAMKEDVESMLASDESLSEEFKEKASTLFEAAVENRVLLETARIEEEYEIKLEEKLTESVDELHSQVDKYMSYVVEQWMKQNEVAIESNFRSQITDNFVTGLKNLFAENYIEVPEEKIDLVADLEEKVSNLEESIESIQAENIELNNLIREARIESVFDEVSEGLAETQIEKLRSLSEGLEFDTVEEYNDKLNIIKNQYFNDDINESKNSTGLIDEDGSVGSNDFSQEDIVPAEMKSYFNAISKTIKK